MATQSERLGYEFAKWLGVQTPQVVPLSPIISTILGHKSSPTLLDFFCSFFFLIYLNFSFTFLFIIFLLEQARVIHNCSSEWLQIKEAAEKARATATSEGDEIGEMTCSELLEALELSRCLFLMR